MLIDPPLGQRWPLHCPGVGRVGEILIEPTRNADSHVRRDLEYSILVPVNYDLEAPDTRAPSATPSIVLEPLAGAACAGGECPAIYRTDRGTLVVQGYTFPPGDAGMDLPSGEQMVEIPVELFATCAEMISS